MELLVPYQYFFHAKESGVGNSRYLFCQKMSAFLGIFVSHEMDKNKHQEDISSSFPKPQTNKNFLLLRIKYNKRFTAWREKSILLADGSVASGKRQTSNW